MDIYEALKTVSWKKRMYFIWKHDLQWDQDAEKHTEESLIKVLRVKSLNEYIKWERSGQYLQLLNLFLETKFANDLEQIYSSTQQKAIDGDEKAIKLLLDIQKQITAFNKENNKKPKEEASSVYDDLEL